MIQFAAAVSVVAAVAGLANYVMLQSIRLAIANLRVKIGEDRAHEREHIQEWVETNFERSAARR